MEIKGARKTFLKTVLVCAFLTMSAVVIVLPETSEKVMMMGGVAYSAIFRVSTLSSPAMQLNFSSDSNPSPVQLLRTVTYDLSLPYYPASLAPEVNGHFLSERAVLSLPGARRLDDVSSWETSVLSILGGAQVYSLGSEVRVRVDVRTRGGQQKRHGGDNIRVWLRDAANKANAAGYVVDLGNGSYIGLLRAMWAGKAEVVAAIATPLEQIQLMYRLYASRGTLREIKAEFLDRHKRIMTSWCFPLFPHTLKTAAGTEVCNLTSKNFGNEWYCYRPPHASCQDYQHFHYMEPYGPLPLTPFEKGLLPFFHRKLKTTLSITVKADAGESVVRATTPCHQRPWAESFVDATPVGFFFRGSWHLSHCDVRASSSLLAYRPCLQNKTLYLFGDSTMRFLLAHLSKALKLTPGTVKPPRPLRHQPKVFVRPDWNFTAQFYTHGLPLFDRQNEPIEYHLDGIPSDANGLVFMTLHQHFNSFHPEVLKKRVRKIAKAVGRLVKRAPGVQVAIRGCHAYYHTYWDHAIAHDDYWGKLYDRTWKEELFPWRRYVVFIDTWDMTVGAENSQCHPPAPFLDALTQNLLAYTCRK